jgi:hypothetical protein
VRARSNHVAGRKDRPAEIAEIANSSMKFVSGVGSRTVGAIRGHEAAAGGAEPHDGFLRRFRIFLVLHEALLKADFLS